MVLFATLYGAIGALAWLAGRLPDGPIHDAVLALTGGRGLGAFDPSVLGGSGTVPRPSAELWAIAAVAMTGAGVMSLPVAWLYTITRQKRGFRQSVVHTLVLLPVVVAGVVVLVKFSLALAFSLAGIVAAVRFRNTLEDSKDAVFIFVATGVGLSAGVELSVAVTLSAVFNLATIMLFLTDFGRTPSRLEGDRAEERMKRALAVANRTSQFVARLDREILENMAPEQLEAVANRAWQRRKASEADDEGDDERDKFDSTLSVWTDGALRARETVESALGRAAKSWRFQRAETVAGGQKLVYQLRLRKSVQPTAFLDDLRADVGAGVLDADLK